MIMMKMFDEIEWAKSQQLEEEIVPPRSDRTASETVKAATDGGVRETFQDTRGT